MLQELFDDSVGALKKSDETCAGVKKKILNGGQCFLFESTHTGI